MAKKKLISNTHCLDCFHFRTKRIKSLKELKKIRNKYIVPPPKPDKGRRPDHWGISPIISQKLKKDGYVSIVWCNKKKLPIIYLLSNYLKGYSTLAQACDAFEGEDK